MPLVSSLELLHPRVRDLARAKFESLTEIQEKTIPPILAGESVLAIAPTGWGKMEAAMLPVFSKLLGKQDALAKQGKRLEGIQALYVTPLKALNRDLTQRIQSWANCLGLKAEVRHGDTPAGERTRQRDSPPHVLVTTPETLQAVLIAPVLCKSLANVGFVVVDEVHELAGSKRGIQLQLGLERLRLKTPFFQVIGLSATVGDEAMVARFLGGKVRCEKVESKRGLRLAVECPGSEGKTKTEAGEGAENALAGLSEDSRARLGRVEELIESHERTLVFVNTRFVAESLGSLLLGVLGEKAAVHHSSLSKEARVQAESEFKKPSSSLKAIVCTSSLELGIDVGEVDLVIQFVSPRQATRLVQRVGRSGHRKHLTPKGVVIAADEFDCFEAGVTARRAVAGELEPFRLRENALDVLAHQLVGLALDAGGQSVSAEKALELVRKAFCFKTLSEEEMQAVLEQLASARLLFLDGKRFSAASRAKLYYYENLSTIRDSKKFFVKNAVSRKNVALLDEDFVAEFLREGACFIAQGKCWRVLSVSEKEVVVEQGSNFAAAVPEWVGEEIPVEQGTAKEVAWLLAKASDDDGKDRVGGGSGGNGFGGREGDGREDGVGGRERVVDGGGRQGFGGGEDEVGGRERVVDGGDRQGFGVKALKRFCFNAEAEGKARGFAREQAKFFKPDASEVVVEARERLAVVHGFLGSRGNWVLSKAVAESLAPFYGALRARPSPYGFLLEASRELDARKIAGVLESLNEARIKALVESSATDSPLFRGKLLGVAKAFGVVSRDSDLTGFGLKRLAEGLRHTPVFEEALRETLFDKADFSAAASFSRVKALAPAREWSPLAKQFFDFGAFAELIAPEADPRAFEAFKQTLFEKTPRLYCTYCAKQFSWDYARKGAVHCPYCASNSVTTRELSEVEEKKRRGKKLSVQEQKQLRESRKVASLIAAFGSKALLALNTFGVGPQAAARVLAKQREDENAFFADLLEGQKTFLKNRGFWRKRS